jgi:hypothetical protein
MSSEYQTLGHMRERFLEASEALEIGHFHKAARIIREALSSSDGMDQLLVTSATTLADRYVSDGDFSNAASMYRAAIHAQTKLLGSEHAEVCALRKKLAVALWETGGLTPVLLPVDRQEIAQSAI